jgi:hypothetical protein
MKLIFNGSNFFNETSFLMQGNFFNEIFFSMEAIFLMKEIFQ